jgi:hypothetical protein
MTNNTEEFISKLIEAKKLEKDALMMILPEKTKKHVKAIGKEIKEMFLECVLDLEKERNSNEKHNSNVKKIKID